MRHAMHWLPLMGLLAGLALPALSAEWVVYPGGDGPGKGKHIVLVSGDEEYRSEEMLPQLGRILAERHGFKCTVLFAVNRQTGQIEPTVLDNIPGLEALDSADLMIIFTRFRALPDAQMKHVNDYLMAGKPVIGIRTATHAFRGTRGIYAKYDYASKVPGWEGGFGRRVLGETWISHHGNHGSQSTRAIAATGEAQNPILRGCEDIWGPTDVYTVRLPQPEGCVPLLLGEVLGGMKPTDKPVDGAKNHPMLPVAWTKPYSIGGKTGKAFTTTMGCSRDLLSEGFRRLLVNASYWAVGLEKQIPARANVDLIGDYQASSFGFGQFTKGLKPSDYQAR